MTERKQMTDYHELFVVMSKTNTLPEIYNKLKLSSTSVSRYLKQNNIECVKNRDDISKYHDRILELSLANYNLKEIADNLSIEAGSLRSYCISNKIEITKSRKGDIRLTLDNSTSNDYYVYGHYLKDGKLFYIGKGIRGRLNSKHGRSKRWLDFTKNHEWYAEIIVSNLSNSEATRIESNLIKSDSNLINIVKSSSELDLNGLEEVYYYDESSPSCLRWKVWNNQTNHSKKLPGDAAGIAIENEGYKVGFGGKEYKAHRVVLYLHGFDCKDKIVDHVDGNPRNNKVSNLRAITQAKNSRNTKLRSNSKTGVNRVIFVTIKGTFYYRATVTLVGKHKTKVFSVKKYGLIPAFYKACEWRKEQIRLLNEQGAGYTERHGT